MEKDRNKPELTPNDKLKAARERLGLTQQALAGHIKIHDPKTVSRWERGVNFPYPHYRKALTKFFDMSLEDLGLVQHKMQAASYPIENTSAEEVSAAGPFYKMPLPATTFIGRQEEVARVSTLLQQADVRLVTLLGSGGIGKTRLGVQIASQLREYFSDGMCFVTLDTISTPNLVMATIVDALAIPDYGNISITERVKQFLRPKHFLLLLDSFEHVIAAAAQVNDLLQDCQQVKMLVTSCTALCLQTEHRFPVLPLRPESAPLQNAEGLMHCAAVELFVQRAQAVQPNFSVTPKNVEVIVELCKRLDYLPLAIQLAASYSRLLSPEELLARISRGFDLLQDDFCDLPERHQTLFKTFQWSYGLLNSQEQWLFRRLAIFADGATLDTLEAFFEREAPLGAQIIHDICSLLDKSLLERVERGYANSRLVMLNTIREYGLKSLSDEGKLEEYQRAHATYYGDLVEKAATHLTGPEQDYWLQLLDQERHNLQSALKWLIEHKETVQALYFCETFGKFCGLRGYWSIERHWLMATLALPCPSEDKKIWARVLRRAGHLAYRFSDLETARRLQEQSIASSRECADKQNLAGALVGLGLVAYRQKDVSYAEQLLREGVCIARETGDGWTIVNALENLGRFLHFQGQLDEAYILLMESMTHSSQLSDKESTARILTTLASLEIDREHLAEAAGYAHKSLELARKFGAPPLIALGLNSMSNVACQQKDYVRAKQYLFESMAIAREIGDGLAVAKRHLKLAKIALVEGDLQTMNTFVREESYQQYNIPEMMTILGECRRYITEKRERN